MAVSQALKNLNSLNDYSTTEKVVGRWTDGKPVYEKIFTGTVSTSETFIPVGASVSEFVSLRGLVYFSSQDRYFTFTAIDAYGAAEGHIMLEGYGDNADSRYKNTVYLQQVITTYFNQPFKVIARYTKTTD